MIGMYDKTWDDPTSRQVDASGQPVSEPSNGQTPPDKAVADSWSPQNPLGDAGALVEGISGMEDAEKLYRVLDD